MVETSRDRIFGARAAKSDASISVHVIDALGIEADSGQHDIIRPQELDWLQLPETSIVSLRGLVFQAHPDLVGVTLRGSGASR